jgi:protease-4
MWAHLRRAAALAYYNLSDGVLWSIGRRPPYAVLKLELAGDVPEQAPDYRFRWGAGRPRQDLFGLMSLLRAARHDPALRAVWVSGAHLRAGWATVLELRRGLAALRQAGKPLWFYLSRGSLPEYVLASAASRVILAPAGTLDIAGLSSEVTFVGGALRKLGVEPQIVQLGRFKSAGEVFTRTDMSASHREMIEGLVDDLYGQLVEAVAQGRGLPPAAGRQLLDNGPFTAEEALAAGLVDAVQYEDEAEASFRALVGDAPSIDGAAYAARRARVARRAVLREARPAIGLLHLTGTVKMGESLPGPEPVSATGVTAVTRDLKTLRERDDIGAVVLRVSSPGGSGLASDLIWREVVRTRESKPVVVSLGDVAASGGYYAAVAARPVVAEGATITGSIGVLAGKAVLRGVYEQFGVTKEVVRRGRHAGLYSDYVRLGPEDRNRLRTEAESFYQRFIAKVVAGRALSPTAVESVAQGRVWTGRQAHALGLVDILGGLERALDEAKALLGIEHDEPVVVDRYPRPKGLWKLPWFLSSTRPRLASVGLIREAVLSDRVWALLPLRLRFF